jgi:hypothetical protein
LIKGLALACGLVGGIIVFAPGTAQAQDPSFLSLSVGRYDFNRQKKPTEEGGMQYRSDLKLWIFQPMAGFMVNGHGSAELYAGISLDIFLGNRIVVRPSFAPGYYHRGGGEDLGYKLEFRSAIEAAYRFDDRSRLGIEVYHMSNASLGKINPGEESINLVYSLPTTKIASWFGN